MAEKPGRSRKRSSKQYNVRAVERAIAVLNTFSIASQELSLKEVAGRTGLSKPTTFRILSTLENHRYLRFEAASMSYRLGSKLLELGGVALSSSALRGVARPHLNQLQALTGSTVLLGTLMDGALVYIDKRETAGPIRIASDIGWRRTPHFGMLGQILLAFQEPEELEKLLAEAPLVPHTRYSPATPEAFEARLGEIRRDGYVVESNEAIEGVWGVAAPIHGLEGNVIAAVGIASPLSERSEPRIAELVAAVRGCADSISEGLGWKQDAAGALPGASAFLSSPESLGTGGNPPAVPPGRRPLG
jgi:IclR family transcriptional regulator, KDG regulon repressor